MNPMEISKWLYDYGGWLILALLLLALFLSAFLNLLETQEELTELKKNAQKEKEIIPTLYVRHNRASYRIKVIGKAVWCERQSPRGDNLTTNPNADYFPVLYEHGCWDFTTVQHVIGDYEALSQEGGQ